jgi:hypothetical protein
MPETPKVWSIEPFGLYRTIPKQSCRPGHSTWPPTRIFPSACRDTVCGIGKAPRSFATQPLEPNDRSRSPFGSQRWTPNHQWLFPSWSSLTARIHPRKAKDVSSVVVPRQRKRGVGDDAE